jgi:hypothetical protein
MKPEPIKCAVRAKLYSSDAVAIEITRERKYPIAEGNNPMAVLLDKSETAYLADELFKLYKQMQ